MRFLNPKTDYAFKKIFGSDHSHEILVSFLNAILGLSSPYCIAEVEILDPYQAPRIQGMKESFVDVRARDENGKNYIIEMQVLNMQGFEQRVLYNACKAYANQLGSSEAYHLLTEVIALTITDFVMFKDDVGIINTFKMRSSKGAVYHDDLELVFVELPKFTKKEQQLSTDQDRWLYFLKKARDLKMIPPVLQENPSIVRAFEIADYSNMTREEEDTLQQRVFFTESWNNVRQKALSDGWEQGMERGMDEQEQLS